MAVRNSEKEGLMMGEYVRAVKQLELAFQELESLIRSERMSRPFPVSRVRKQLEITRLRLKEADLFLRYGDPIAQKYLNGPLPVEWETEVFEKFEKPYRRVGAGLALLTESLEESDPQPDSLLALLGPGKGAFKHFLSDSMQQIWSKPDAFYLANRLFILNLASIYTTGFDCPDPGRIIPELKAMVEAHLKLIHTFNVAFPGHRFSPQYLDKSKEMNQFLQSVSDERDFFNHYAFIQYYVNPLFKLNQSLIKSYQIKTQSLVDYSLNEEAVSLFSKNLYFAQDPNGVFNRLESPEQEKLADSLGKMLFFDPILSGNNERSCASCHNPATFFADTTRRYPESYEHQGPLERNTPSLLNVLHHHLLMHDGRFYTLQQQVADVIQNPKEMAGKEKEIMEKVLSCATYKNGFESLLPYTPTETKVSFAHLVSALTRYIGKFSSYPSPFDKAMDGGKSVSLSAQKGFNLFMGKAQCATCHFVPQFNGVKPPFSNSEFEVLGTPADPAYTRVSPDLGRAQFFDAPETRRAFRTGSVRNSSRTVPYMHNGVFGNMEELIAFYDAGGGAGKGLNVPNQTLPSDSLHLSEKEKKDLIAFMQSLNEEIKPEKPPKSLPVSTLPQLNSRRIGGLY